AYTAIKATGASAPTLQPMPASISCTAKIGSPAPVRPSSSPSATPISPRITPSAITRKQFPHLIEPAHDIGICGARRFELALRGAGHHVVERAVQRLAHGGELLRDALAVLLALDHAHDRAHLPFRALQARLHPLLPFVPAGHHRSSIHVR